MVHTKYKNFLDYEVGLRMRFREAMDELYEKEVCPNCGEPVHTITKDNAHGPLFEAFIFSGHSQTGLHGKVGDVRVDFMCYKCGATHSFWYKWNSKETIKQILKRYEGNNEYYVHKLLSFNIWERIKWKIMKKLGKKVPYYAV